VPKLSKSVKFVKVFSDMFETQCTGWPQKCKPLPNDEKIVLKQVNESRYIRQIKV